MKSVKLPIWRILALGALLCASAFAGCPRSGSEGAESASAPRMDFRVRYFGGQDDPALTEMFRAVFAESMAAGTHLGGSIEIERSTSQTAAHAEFWDPARALDSGFELRVTEPACAQGGPECDVALARRLAELSSRAQAVVGGDDEGLRGALGSAEEAIAVVALREVQRRGDRSFCPELGRAADPEMSDAALLALSGTAAELRCEAAVPAMIAALDVSRRELMISVIPALAAIGGSEALRFLQVVASGHQDPATRASARDALRSMGHPTE